MTLNVVPEPRLLCLELDLPSGPSKLFPSLEENITVCVPHRTTSILLSAALSGGGGSSPTAPDEGRADDQLGRLPSVKWSRGTLWSFSLRWEKISCLASPESKAQ